jgi:hypothetical protein
VYATLFPSDRSERERERERERALGGIEGERVRKRGRERVRKREIKRERERDRQREKERDVEYGCFIFKRNDRCLCSFLVIKWDYIVTNYGHRRSARWKNFNRNRLAEEFKAYVCTNPNGL